MERSNNAGASSRRWTCEACGCNTNSENDRTCSICGTSSGSSLLRRAGNAARVGLFARSVAARRSFLSEELGMEGYELWDRADDDADMQDDEDEQAIAALAMEVAGVSGRDAHRQRSVLEAARSFAMATREISRPDPTELLRAAYDNGSSFQPKWMNPSQIGGRMRTGNGIEVGDGENQNVAHLPLGAGEGRALRALEAFPRSAPFASFNLTPPNNPGQERRPRRAFGFRVTFEHPTKENGENMGGCYLVGVTTTSFAAFSEKNALQQSPFFWGIEDSGNKYEGARYHSSGGSRRGQSSYAVELTPAEAPRNEDDVLFGSREVVTCVIDLDSRSLTFWRNEELLGTLVTNVPRGGNLYPVVVPFNAGSTVAVTGMGDDPLPLLRSFATDWKQAQQEKHIQRRQKLLSERSVLVRNGMLTPELVNVLREIYRHSSSNPYQNVQLNRVEASRLWYRCGMKLSHLDELLKTKIPPSNEICFEDFLENFIRVVQEEDDEFLSRQQSDSQGSTVFQVGDKVELVEGYERFGDASNGPLHPGDRGTVIELQEGPTGDRWWYQPQALVREKSGLIEPPEVWFLRTVLRAFGYDHTTLQLLAGNQVTANSWQVGDIVQPKKLALDKRSEKQKRSESHSEMEQDVGRIVAESSSSTSSLTARGRESGSVLVEFISKVFAESAGIQSGRSFQDSPLSLEVSRVPINRLVHSSNYHRTFQRDKSSINDTAMQHSKDIEQNNNVESMDIAKEEDYSGAHCSISEKTLADMKKMVHLDLASIDNVTKKCKKNATALASIFSAGLQDAVLEAMDFAANKVRNSEDGENLSQAISALGKLALVVVDCAFPDGCQNEDHCPQNEDSQELIESPASEDEPTEQPRQSNARRNSRNEQRGPRSLRSSDSALLQDLGRANRLSSVQQRRNMLLALMSRARRANVASINDILNRETHGSNRDASISNMMPPFGPFRQDAAALLFGPSIESPHGWDDFVGYADEDGSTDAADLILPPRNRRVPGSAPAPSGDTGNNSCPSFLDTILRGRAEKTPSQTSAGKSAGTIQTSALKTVIANGLLGNSFLWLKTTLYSEGKRLSTTKSPRSTPLLQSAVDEDGTPLLQLAISLGCTGAIIKHLIRLGAPVGETEIKLAVKVDQPEALSVLLRSSVYSEGLVDTNSCSSAIAEVIREASLRQETQHGRMRLEAGTLLVLFLQKLLQLGLFARRHQINFCGGAIAGALVGNAVFVALQKKQKQTSSFQGGEPDISAQEESGRQASEGAGPTIGSTRQGLLQTLPDDVLGKSLDDNSSSLTTFLLLVEDYLCSKEINDSTIGLTLLQTLLRRYPSFNQSSEVERYGFAELLSSHDAFASNRLSDISSRVAGREAETAVVVLCPKKHAATLHVTRHSSFRCDLCGKGVERGRVMHGCRECDWDACERCTDKAEGGIVKWNHIRELACECQQMLTNSGTCKNEGMGPKSVWANTIVENLKVLDNSSEVNNLSIRILQRDPDSIKELGSILSAEGQLTMYQFLSVILPALHASLVGRPSGSGRNLGGTGFCRRSKKPRVVGSRSRDADEVHASSSEDRLEFAHNVLKRLINDSSEDRDEMSCGDENSGGADQRPEKSRREESDDDDEDEESENGLTEDDVKENVEDNRSAKQKPELLRRLHQILALYESVATLPNVQHTTNTDGLRGGDLKSLTKPIELFLLPSGSRKRLKAKPMRENVLRVQVEPLTSVEDLSRHVLLTCKISHPYYLAFCRRLVTDCAMIIERSSKKIGISERKWRVAKVTSFDEDNGWHGVNYASGLTGRTGEPLEIKSKNSPEVKRLQFDKVESKLILTGREFYIIFRGNVAGGNKSAFDMEHLLTDGIVPVDDEETLRTPQKPSVGRRVESNFKSTDWRPYTVLAVDDDGDSSRQREDQRYILVSDEGEVVCAVPSSQIRGLDCDDTLSGNENLSGSAGRDIFAGRGRESRGQSSRAFPFLSARRAAEGQRNGPIGSVQKPHGVLKRTWSALSPIESMCSIEVHVTHDGKPVLRQGNSFSGIHEWRCDVGHRQVDVFVERSVLELPPRLRVGFSAQQMMPPDDMASQSDTTLLSLLWQIYQRNEQQMFADRAHEIFYSVTCEPKSSTDRYRKHSTLVASGFCSSLTASELAAQQSKTTKTSHFSVQDFTEAGNEVMVTSSEDMEKQSAWPTSSRSRKLTHLTSYSSEEEGLGRGLCDGLDEMCVQCMEVISLLADIANNSAESKVKSKTAKSVFESKILSKKLLEQLEDPLMVVGGGIPDWCFIAPSFAPRVFSYKARRLLLERAAFGVSRSTLRQQESKVNVGRLRQRMASLRARAVELVGEAFSGGAEDPTALQLQADELYGMEEALAARVRASFRAEKWEEHSLQVAKAAVHRDLLISDAVSVMHQYANDDQIAQRRLEVRFDGESGFDAAAGDEAGVTRGFYADVAEALISCDIVAGVSNASFCPDEPSSTLVTIGRDSRKGLPCKLPLWIPDVDASGQVIIPTPRADQNSGLGVYPRPLSNLHPQISEVLAQFRFMGRLFASAVRDGFMFPLPLSSAFLKLVQHGNDESAWPVRAQRKGVASLNRPTLSKMESESSLDEGDASGSGKIAEREVLLSVTDLPRPGFLGGEVYAVETHICSTLDRIDQLDPPLMQGGLERRYREIATDKSFARVALGKSYDCSFEEYFQDRTFVDPLDPTQGLEATPLCANGHDRSVTINNIREWVALAKYFILQDGVIAQALSFRQGVEDFFSADYLKLFAAEELQSDVCGVGDNVDNWDESSIRKLFKLDGGKGAAEALVAVAAIGGEGGAALSRRFGPSSPTINFVVKALLEATPKMRRQFISFVTSVPIVTPGQIEVVPVVSPSGDFLPMRDPGCLPRANTCARRLYLPKFETYESFSQVLWAVVGEESKFKGFYEWRGS